MEPVDSYTDRLFVVASQQLDVKQEHAGVTEEQATQNQQFAAPVSVSEVEEVRNCGVPAKTHKQTFSTRSPSMNMQVQINRQQENHPKQPGKSDSTLY